MDQVVAAFKAFEARWQRNVAEHVSINLFGVNKDDDAEDRSASDINASYFYLKLLINILIHIKSSPNDINEFIEACAKEYVGNSIKLKEVHNVYSNYKPTDALCWYTKPTFLYTELNRALRVRNGNLISLYRFFIRDIHNQLITNQCKKSVRVYRGQLISKYELKRMYESEGRLIAMNSFLSSSFDRDSANFFLGSPQDAQETKKQKLIPVLFEIYAEPEIASITGNPFADITPFSHFAEAEQEILFMIGSVFRLSKVRQEMGMWIVEMTLSNDNEDQARLSFDYMIKRNDEEDLQTDEPTLRTLGKMLIRFDCSELSEKYVQRQLYEIKSLTECAATEDEDVRRSRLVEEAKCYELLAIIAEIRIDYRLAIRNLNQALTIYATLFNENDHLCFAKIHMRMGTIYLAKLKPKRALQSFETALSIYHNHYGDEHLHIASCYQIMSYAYSQLKQSSKCFECIKKGYEMHERLKSGPDIGYLPTNHTLTGAENPWYSLPPHHRSETPSISDVDAPVLSNEEQITTTDIVKDVNDGMDDSWIMPREPFMTPKILYCETEDHQILEIPLKTDRSILYKCPRCKEYVSLSSALRIFKGVRCRYCIKKIICCGRS